MLKRMIAAATLLLLAACGQDDSVMAEIERREAAEAKSAADNLAAAQAYMAETCDNEGVTRQPSGLCWEITSPGPNQRRARPGAGAQVLVHYEGRLPNGEIFDSSMASGQPVQFGVSEVVPGFGEAVTLMRPGDELTAYIPPELGYGPQGSPPAIPGNSPLIFRIRLLAFQENGRIVEAPRR